MAFQPVVESWYSLYFICILRCLMLTARAAKRKRPSSRDAHPRNRRHHKIETGREGCNGLALENSEEVHHKLFRLIRRVGSGIDRLCSVAHRVYSPVPTTSLLSVSLPSALQTPPRRLIMVALATARRTGRLGSYREVLTVIGEPFKQPI